MVSLITSSYNENFYIPFEKNVCETIGVPYEIVKINNPGVMSIAQAYNEGIKKSQYPILCFVHEDVIFRTKNWGNVLVENFNTIGNLGCIGVAGATYKTKVLSGWWDAPEIDKVINIVQYTPASNGMEHWNFGWQGGSKYKEVVLIDGVFMVTKKEFGFVFDDTIPGFHGYDLNISMEIRNKLLKVIVTNEILLEHFSYGVVKKDWYVSLYKLHRKYSSILPQSLGGEKFRKEYEFNILSFYTYRAIELRLKKMSFFLWRQLFVMKPFLIQNLRTLKKILNK